MLRVYATLYILAAGVALVGEVIFVTSVYRILAVNMAPARRPGNATVSKDGVDSSATKVTYTVH